MTRRHKHARIHQGDEAEARELVRELKAALGERHTVAIAVD
ncbi:hypothetical protein LCGC14_1839150, partial [marine sediment metagenome]